MRVQVPQHEAEEGELLDGVVEADAALHRVDDPGGPPPPPALLGVPGGLRDGGLQAFDVQSLPERGRAKAPDSGELQYAFQVRHQPEEDDAPQPAEKGGLPGRSASHHQGHRQPQEADSRQRRDQGHAEVVRHRRGDSGDFGQRPHHEVAEVVVVDRVAQEPHVLRGEGGGLCSGAEQPQVHQLLGVVDAGIEGAEEGPPGEDQEKDALQCEHQAPLPAEKRQQVGALPPRQDAREHGQAGQQQEGRRTGHGQAHAAEDPEGVGQEEQAEGLGEAVPAVLEVAAEAKGDGKRQQAQ